MENPAFAAAMAREIVLTGLHVHPRLAVGDSRRRELLIHSCKKELGAAPNHSDRQTACLGLRRTRRRPLSLDVARQAMASRKADHGWHEGA